MLIDPQTIPFSRDGTGVSNGLDDQLSLIEGMASLLPSLGWTLTNNYFPASVIGYPLGAPVTAGVSAPLIPVGCNPFPFLNLDGINFTLFDPFTEAPPPAPACVFVALDTTAAGTLGNLATAIGNTGNWSGAVTPNGSGGFDLTITATTPGASLNYATIIPDGAWGAGPGFADGGGYEFQSSGVNTATVYKVKVTARGIFNPSSGNFTQPIHFDFTINSQVGTEYILDSGNNNYSLYANGYGFAILDPGNLGATSIFCQAPFIPSDPPGYSPSSYAMFVVGPPGTQFTQGTFWGPGTHTTALDSNPSTFSSAGPFPRALALRSPGPALDTPDDMPIVYPAWVMFGAGPTGHAYVVGQLWDCLIVNDFVPGMTFQGKKFKMIASTDGSGATTKSTLMFCIG